MCSMDNLPNLFLLHALKDHFRQGYKVLPAPVSAQTMGGRTKAAFVAASRNRSCCNYLVKL
jgi:hypothetical protein